MAVIKVVLALLRKGGVKLEQLLAPEISLVSQFPDKVTFRITRKDIRGTSLEWRISADSSFGNPAENVLTNSGVLSDTGNVEILSSGYPIRSFYAQVFDRATGFISGTSEILRISVDEPETLAQPSFSVTPGSASLSLRWFTVANASKYQAYLSTDLGVTYSMVYDGTDFTHVVTGLTNGVKYFIKIIAIPATALFLPSFVIGWGTPMAVQVLPTPTDLLFTEGILGALTVGVVYAGEPGITYTVQRNGITVYSGTTPTTVIQSHVANTSYTYRVKVSKAGFTDSTYYEEIYTYSPATEEYDYLEDYGGNSFYKTFWGKLTYTPHTSGTTKVTYQGSDSPFSASYIGKWLEPSRIHHSPAIYPSTGRNYAPSVICTVYSKVLEVIDGKNLVVDFPYNGRNRATLSAIANQDGIFFHDNKSSVELWSKNLSRKPLSALTGSRYAVLGMPICEVKAASPVVFHAPSPSNPPIMHLMMSDSFSCDLYGRGDSVCPTFTELFGSNSSMFLLPSSGNVNVDFQWQFVGSTYLQTVVQYGGSTGNFFSDPVDVSTQYGLKRIVNNNQYVIRDEMQAALGFVRPGVAFSMPSQAYCIGGGLPGVEDVDQFNIYRFEGMWEAKDPCNTKARFSGGVKLEWLGPETGARKPFKELESLKGGNFSGLSLLWENNRKVTISPTTDFSWYQLASQEWTGGTRYTEEYSYLRIKDYKIGMGTDGDFSLLYGDSPTAGRNFSTTSLNLFDRITVPGNVIRQDLSNHENNGLIAKESNNVFHVWGWSVQVGDVYTFAGVNYTVTKVSRAYKSWKTYGAMFPTMPAFLNTDGRRINYTAVTFNNSVTAPLSDVIFTVTTSVLAGLLGTYTPNFKAVRARFFEVFDASGHLMYVDSGINLKIRNADIFGFVRATSHTLYGQILSALSPGTRTSIDIKFDDGIIKNWTTGKKLWLVDPVTGNKQQLTVSANWNNAISVGSLSINSTNLLYTYPVGSYIVGLFNLPSVAEFDRVFFVNEDGTPKYSERIEYRPYGIRIRQNLTGNSMYRFKFKGGRWGYFQGAGGFTEPQLDISGRPHIVGSNGATRLLNPVFSDTLGAVFGYQTKGQLNTPEDYYPTYIILDNHTTNIQNSELAADLSVVGKGTLLVNNLISRRFMTGLVQGAHFNLGTESQFAEVNGIIIEGSGGTSGIKLANRNWTLIPIGKVTLTLTSWNIVPATFNNTGFIVNQDKSNLSLYCAHISVNGACQQ